MKSCPVRKDDRIDEDLQRLYPFPDTHKEGVKMAQLAIELSKRRGDIYGKVPFCNTVEAEAMGATVRLGGNNTTPLIKETRWNSIDDVKIIRIDPGEGRMGQVIKAIEYMTQEKRPSMLEVAGPFSTLMGILDSRVLFKTLRKNPLKIETCLEAINSNLILYLSAAVEQGLTMVSIAEPAGTAELVGPKVFENTVAPSLIKLMNQMETIEGDWACHLCGRLSTSMRERGLLEEQTISTDCKTYGEALEKFRSEGIKWFSGNCVAMTSKACKKVKFICR